MALPELLYGKLSWITWIWFFGDFFYGFYHGKQLFPKHQKQIQDYYKGIKGKGLYKSTPRDSGFRMVKKAHIFFTFTIHIRRAMVFEVSKKEKSTF